MAKLTLSQFRKRQKERKRESARKLREFKKRRKSELRSRKIREALDRSAVNIKKTVQESTAKKLGVKPQDVKVVVASTTLKDRSGKVISGFIPASQFKRMGGKVQFVGRVPVTRRFTDKDRVITERGFYSVDPRSGKRSFTTEKRTTVKKALPKTVKKQLKERKLRADISKASLRKTRVSVDTKKVTSKTIRELEDKLFKIIKSEEAKRKRAGEVINIYLDRIGVKRNTKVGQIIRKVTNTFTVGPTQLVEIGRTAVAFIGSAGTATVRNDQTFFKKRDITLLQSLIKTGKGATDQAKSVSVSLGKLAVGNTQGVTVNEWVMLINLGILLSVGAGKKIPKTNLKPSIKTTIVKMLKSKAGRKRLGAGAGKGFKKGKTVKRTAKKPVSKAELKRIGRGFLPKKISSKQKITEKGFVENIKPTKQQRLQGISSIKRKTQVQLVGGKKQIVQEVKIKSGREIQTQKVTRSAKGVRIDKPRSIRREELRKLDTLQKQTSKQISRLQSKGVQIQLKGKVKPRQTTKTKVKVVKVNEQGLVNIRKLNQKQVKLYNQLKKNKPKSSLKRTAGEIRSKVEVSSGNQKLLKDIETGKPIKPPKQAKVQQKIKGVRSGREKSILDSIERMKRKSQQMKQEVAKLKKQELPKPKATDNPATKNKKVKETIEVKKQVDKIEKISTELNKSKKEFIDNSRAISRQARTVKAKSSSIEKDLNFVKKQITKNKQSTTIKNSLDKAIKTEQAKVQQANRILANTQSNLLNSRQILSVSLLNFDVLREISILHIDTLKFLNDYNKELDSIRNTVTIFKQLSSISIRKKSPSKPKKPPKPKRPTVITKSPKKIKKIIPRKPIRPKKPPKPKRPTKPKRVIFKLPKLQRKKLIQQSIKKRLDSIPKTKFRPSLVAVLNDIKGKVPDRITGAELRPIIDKAIKKLTDEEKKKKKKRKVIKKKKAKSKK